MAYTKSFAVNSRFCPLKTGSSAKWTPFFTLMVQVSPSAEISGSASATRGTTLCGRAR